MGEKQLEEKVLEYWFALEFLAQDKYPDSWDVKKEFRNVKEQKINLTGYFLLK